MTLLLPAAPPEPDAPSADEPAPARGRRLDRLVLALGAVLLLTGGLFSSWLLTLLGLVAAGASLSARSARLDVSLLRSVAGLLVAAITLGELAALLQVDITGVALAAAGLLFLAACTATVLRRPATAAGVRRGSPVTALPALVASVVALLQLDIARAANWGFAATDVAAHMGALVQLARDGQLDYTDNVYPRGAHALLGLVKGTVDPLATGTGTIPDALALVAVGTWLSYALLLLAVCALTERLLARTSVPAWLRAGAVVGLGVSWLLNDALTSAMLYQGAFPSLLAVAVLLWPGIELLDRGATRLQADLPIAVAVVVVLAHLWQPLAAVAVAGALAVHLGALPRHLAASTPRQRIADAAVVLVGIALVLPSAAGLLAGGGTSIAAITGRAAAPPWWLLGAALVTAVACRRAGLPRCARRLLLGLLGGGVFATAVLLRGAGSFDLTAYYPQKMVWFVVLLVSPFVAAALAVVTAAVLSRLQVALSRLGGAARVVRVGGAAVLVALSVVVLVPGLLVRPPAVLLMLEAPAQSAGMSRMQLAQEFSKPGRGVVVPVALGSSPVFDSGTSYIVARTLSAVTGQTPNRGKPWQVCDEVEMVGQGRPVAVATSMDVDFLRGVMTRLGCGDVTVLQATGGLNDDREYWADQLEDAIERRQLAGTAPRS